MDDVEQRYGKDMARLQQERSEALERSKIRIHEQEREIENAKKLIRVEHNVLLLTTMS